METNNPPPLNKWQDLHGVSTPALDYCDSITQIHIKTLTDWPEIHCYNEIFPSAPLTFIQQDNDLMRVCGGYERFIAKYQSIPTRPKNTHDFMNALSWQHFPRSKLALHQMQMQEYEQQRLSKHNKRSPRQNACTLFDECGVIFVSENDCLVQAIRDHEWQSLFYDKRATLSEETRIYVFGHALLEKSLHPYIGMCGNVLHLACATDTPLTQLDGLLAQQLRLQLQNTADLLPFPILGYPGWHPENASPDFYQNDTYFRPLRPR